MALWSSSTPDCRKLLTLAGDKYVTVHYSAPEVLECREAYHCAKADLLEKLIHVYTESPVCQYPTPERIIMVFRRKKKEILLSIETDDRRLIEDERDRKDVDTTVRKHPVCFAEGLLVILDVLEYVFRNYHVKRAVRKRQFLKVLAEYSLFQFLPRRDSRQKIGTEKVFVIVKHAPEWIVYGGAENPKFRPDLWKHRYARYLRTEFPLQRLRDMPLARGTATEYAIHVISRRPLIGAYEQRPSPAYIASAPSVMPVISDRARKRSSHHVSFMVGRHHRKRT